jgi:RNA polymerase sigma-70 factor
MVVEGGAAGEDAQRRLVRMHAPVIEASLVARLFEQSRAARWGLTVDRFEAALVASLTHASGAAPGGALDAERYLTGLQVEDLGLAVACAAGLEPAWVHFMLEYRALLARAASAIDSRDGPELADSLHAELFGLQIKGGERQSLFRYFHGRSRLATWLRAILAQRHIDRLRSRKKEEPLPEDEQHLPEASPRPAADPERARFLEMIRTALTAAIASLDARDRLRLGCYYAQDMTLAAIGKMLGEHEATVSRHLTRSRRDLRARVETALRENHRLNDEAVAECFRSVSEDAGMLDLADILGTAAPRKIGPQNRSST